jgi:hypothetical protein
LTSAIHSDSAELQKLVDRQQGQILLRDGGQKHLKSSKAHNQEKQVEENILRLRVAQAEKAIAHEGDKVYSLEKQKLELDTVSYSRLHFSVLFFILALEIGGSDRFLNVFFAKNTYRNHIQYKIVLKYHCCKFPHYNVD